TTAGLFFMMLRDVEGGRDRSPCSWSSSVILWLLTAKPPLALTAGLALLTRGRWGVLIRAAGLTLVATLAVTPWLGAGWLHDYRRFALAGQLAWPIVPLQMSNLCALLSIEFGLSQEVATRWTTILWGGSFVATVLAGWARPLPAGPTWALCIMAYLLL